MTYREKFELINEIEKKIELCEDAIKTHPEVKDEFIGATSAYKNVIQMLEKIKVERGV